MTLDCVRGAMGSRPRRHVGPFSGSQHYGLLAVSRSFACVQLIMLAAVMGCNPLQICLAGAPFCNLASSSQLGPLGILPEGSCARRGTRRPERGRDSYAGGRDRVRLGAQRARAAFSLSPMRGAGAGGWGTKQFAVLRR